jgi:hypothetical protein
MNILRSLSPPIMLSRRSPLGRHMVHRALKLDSDLSRHSLSSPICRKSVNICWLTPFTEGNFGMPAPRLRSSTRSLLSKPSTFYMINLDPRTTALVLIDLQKPIVGMPLSPYSGDEVVSVCTGLAGRFRKAGARVVLVNVAFSKDFGDALRSPVDEPFPHPPGGLPKIGPIWLMASPSRLTSEQGNTQRGQSI